MLLILIFFFMIVFPFVFRSPIMTSRASLNNKYSFISGKCIVGRIMHGGMIHRQVNITGLNPLVLDRLDRGGSMVKLAFENFSLEGFKSLKIHQQTRSHMRCSNMHGPDNSIFPTLGISYWLLWAAPQLTTVPTLRRWEWKMKYLAVKHFMKLEKQTGKLERN